MRAPSPFDPLTFAHGPAMPNRFMLAPITNTQSRDDGVLSEDEFRWLTLRAQGGFGLTMTCAANVQENGRESPGQLGIYSDVHLDGLKRLAEAIRAAGSLAAVQLHHAGNRSPRDLVSEVVSSSDGPESGARGLHVSEVEALVGAFVAAAVRADRAGFHGVEIQGGHGYIITQFLSPKLNRRTDRFGGSLENRMRLLFEILDGVRASCRSDFQMGLRLSPERFGLPFTDAVQIAREALSRGGLDYLDMSLWGPLQEPTEEAYKGRSLMSYFTELDRGDVRLGVACSITNAVQAAEMLAAGADYVLVGRTAILHHDFPRRARDPNFEATPLPVDRHYLSKEGLSPSFINYISNIFPGFVEGA